MKPEEFQFEYNSFWERLPTGNLIMILLLVTSPITFFSTVDSQGWWLFIIHFIAICAFSALRQQIMPMLRGPGMQRAADRLGLRYSEQEHVDWLPPDYNYNPDTKKCFNVLRGTYADAKVLIFDSKIERSYVARTKNGGSTRRTSTRSEYNVVQVEGRRKLPSFLIAKGGYCGSESLPIPGTKYHLFSSSTSDFETVGKLITDLVVEFLAVNPGWVIEVHDKQITVFDDRFFNARCQSTANVPAFLEDVLCLLTLFTEGLDDDVSRGVFSIENAMNEKLRTSMAYQNDRAIAVRSACNNAGAGTLAAFGLIWNLMCLLIFGVMIYDGGAPMIVQVVFPLIFFSIGLGLMVPWFLTQMRLGSSDVSIPTVRITGDAPRLGSTLHVDVSQKNLGSDALYDVAIRLKLGQRSGHVEQSQLPGVAKKWVQPKVANVDDVGWSTEETIKVGRLDSGESLSIDHEFQIGNNVNLTHTQWWGIDVETHAGDQKIFEETFWLPQNEYLGWAFAIPGTICLAIWGFFGTFFCGAMLSETLLGGMNGAVFGVISMLTFGGLIGGGWLGFHGGNRLARVPFIRPFADAFSRIHVLIQFVGSFIFAGLSMFFMLFVVGDIWFAANQKDAQKPAQVAEDSDVEQVDKKEGSQKSKSSKPPVLLMREAILQSNVKNIRFLAKQQPSLINAPLPPYGATGLFTASFHDKPDCVRVLLELNAHTELKNRNGATPIHVAAFHGHLEIVKLLAEGGAKLDSKDKQGHTARDKAQQNGHRDVVNYLDAAMRSR